MALKIISGLARGIVLETPSDRSMRPTSGRSREALFSSLGNLQGVRFADIFAGSGAIGLEAASRGAEAVVLLEGNNTHTRIIERNIARIRKAGVECNIELVRRKAIAGALLNIGFCDIWFFDPPYAESADFLRDLQANESLIELWRGSLLIWEMPDTSEARAAFQQIAGLNEKFNCRIKNLGSCDFLFLEVKDR